MYARQSGVLAEEKIGEVLGRCEEAVKQQMLLILNPQFLVTAMR